MRWATLGIGMAVLLLARMLGKGSSSSSPASNAAPVDAYAEKELATKCDPTPKPGVLLFRQFVLARWGERPGSPQNIIRACSSSKSDEHQEGRAWDCMINSLEHGQAIVDAMTAPSSSGEPNELARRAGLMYMIFNRRMWRAYSQGGLERGTWGDYTGPSPHTDHVHFSFSWAGAQGQTSLYETLRRDFPAA